MHRARTAQQKRHTLHEARVTSLAGRFASLTEGERALPIETEVVEPSEQAPVYEGLYDRYRAIPPSLQDFYSR